MYHEGPKFFSYSSLITSKYYRNDYELNTCGLYFLSSKGIVLYPYKRSHLLFYMYLQSSLRNIKMTNFSKVYYVPNYFKCYSPIHKSDNILNWFIRNVVIKFT
jgi:hypothetical protein